MLQQSYSLAILGGGINAVAIARDAAQRGLKVILFEAQDFGSGASSKSSKLAHGGLRYLSTFSFHLVKESLRESALLLKNAPHLVQPLPFLYPVYQGDSYPLWVVKLGLSLYDWLKPSNNFPHQNLASSTIQTLVPELLSTGMRGGCLYYDAQMQDNRLVIENMLSAEQEGATLLNYTEVKKIIKQPAGFQIESCAGTIEAKCVVNATGAWSNLTSSLLNLPLIPVYATKGVHLVLPQIHKQHALALTAPQDGRLFFLIPWMGYSLLGTTDTPFFGNASDVRVEGEDIEYLTTALKHYFPAFTPEILSSFAALRPLASQPQLSPSNRSREHLIQQSSEGLITLLGGKFTTYRQIAEEVVNRVVQFLKIAVLPCRTASTPLYGAGKSISLRPVNLHPTLVQRLIDQYGTATEQILDFIRNDPQEAVQICPHHPHLYAELSYAIQKEKARCPEDWLQRRTSIAYSACRGECCLNLVAKKF